MGWPAEFAERVLKDYERKMERMKDVTVEQLKANLEEEYLTAENPKRHILFSKAWELGHAHGLHEVANMYGDLVELIE